MKRLVTALFLVMSLMAIGQSKDLEVNSNFLVLTNISDSEKEITSPAKDIRFRIVSGRVYFYDQLINSENTIGKKAGYEISEIQDKANSIVFTEESLYNFLYEKAGFSSASGGSEAEVFDIGTGWATYGDSQYTEANPLTVNSGEDAVVDIDGLGFVDDSQLPSGIVSFYNTETAKITPENIGDYYDFTLNFKGKNTNNNGYGIVSINIGGTQGKIFETNFQFPRGANMENPFNIPITGFSGSTFVPNGGLITISGELGDSEFYDFSLQVFRKYKAKNNDTFSIIGLASQSNGLPTTEDSETVQSIFFPNKTFQIGRFGSENNQIILASSPLDHDDQLHASVNGYDVHYAIKKRDLDINESLLFVPSSKAATGYISGDWGVGNPLYLDFVSRMKKAKELKPEANYELIIVIRGEQDYQNPNFETSLIAEVNGWRDELNSPSLPIVFVTGTNRFHEQFPSMGAYVTAKLLAIANKLNYTSVFDARTGVQHNLRVSALHYSEVQQESIADGILLAEERAKTNTNALGKTPTPAVSNFNVSIVNSEIQVSWDLVPSAYDYWLEYSLNDSEWRYIAVSENTDNGLRTGNSYSFSSLPIAAAQTYDIQQGDEVAFRVAAIRTDNFGVFTEGEVTFNTTVFEQWFFGTDNTGYLSENGVSMTVLGETPVLSSNSVTLPTTANNALITPYGEANSGESETWMIAINNHTPQNEIIAGTYATDNTGRMLYNSTSTSMRELHDGSGFTSGTLNTADGGYTIVALSIGDDGTIRHYVRREGASDSYGELARTPVNNTPRNIALGNAYFSAAYFSPTDYAGFIYTDTFLTEAEIVSMADQFEIDLELRGIRVD